MKYLTLMAALCLPLAASADGLEQAWRAAPETVFDAGEVTLEELRWVARPIVVFADSPRDPAFQEQMELLAQEPNELSKRDVLIITDTDPANPSALRTQLRPRGFMMVLIGKDGGIKLRKPFPWDIRELSHSIDKMPMRKREIEERREGS